MRGVCEGTEGRCGVSTFAVGDVVTRIYDGSSCVPGDRYRVSAVGPPQYPPCIGLEGLGSVPAFEASKFLLAEIRAGDVVRCVDDTGRPDRYRHMGALYRVEKVLVIDGATFLLTNETDSWAADRFSLLTTAETLDAIAKDPRLGPGYMAPEQPKTSVAGEHGPPQPRSVAGPLTDQTGTTSEIQRVADAPSGRALGASLSPAEAPKCRPYCGVHMALADELQAARDELRELLAENARLRRALERIVKARPR
jgi:hypothetical protein